MGAGALRAGQRGGARVRVLPAPPHTHTHKHTSPRAPPQRAAIATEPVEVGGWRAGGLWAGLGTACAHIRRSVRGMDMTVVCLRPLERRHGLDAVDLLDVDCVAKAGCRFRIVVWVLCIGLSVMCVATLGLVS
jgi:hypothetical protein